MATALELVCENYAFGEEQTCRNKAELDLILRRQVITKRYSDKLDNISRKRTTCETENGCPKPFDAACIKCLDDYLKEDSDAKRERDQAERAAEKMRNCYIGYPEAESCLGISARGCKCCDERDAAYNACIKNKGIPQKVTPIVNPPIPASPNPDVDPLKQIMDEYFERRKRLFTPPISLL